MIGAAAQTKDELALQEWENNRLPEASRLLEECLAERETADRWNNWASVQFKTGNARAGELGFRRALELEPQYGQAASNLGAILARDGKTEAAIAMLERALSGNDINTAQREATKNLLAQCRSTLARTKQTESPAQAVIPPDQIYSGYKPEELSIIRDHFCLSPAPMDGFIVDRLGVRTRASSLWDQVQYLSGTVIPPPVPNDFHAEAIEWIGLLKCVRSARSKFVAMELGAGWGPWIVAGATAARNAGIRDICLLGVEGDPGHFGFIQQHFRDNGLNPTEHLLIQAAVGAKAGRARWPRVEPRNSYGTQPIPEGNTISMGTFEVSVVAFADLLRKQPRWDLVHVDVQGSEAVICESALHELKARAHWLIIGTHSRLIEGQLIYMLMKTGWVLENEKPVIFGFHPNAPSMESLTRIDGTQVWRNPRLD
jgi:FkbM family methyltransferase